MSATPCLTSRSSAASLLNGRQPPGKTAWLLTGPTSVVLMCLWLLCVACVPVSDFATQEPSVGHVSLRLGLGLYRTAFRNREAIQIMGDLAVQHGFYGSEWDSSDPTTYEEVSYM